VIDADRWVDLDSGESSLVKGIGTKDNSLLVKFHKGEVYSYSNADSHMDEMLAAESVGKYFVEHVKPLGGKRLGKDL